MQKRSKTKRLLFIWPPILIVCVLALDFIIIPLNTHCTAPIFNSGKNGLWLRYKWYFGQHSEADLQKMCRHLREDQIRFAFFHVRDVASSGALKFHHATDATKMLSAVRLQAPDCKLLAWVYVSSTGVDIANKEVRHKMIDEAKWLVNECGFDGIQWDYEFARNDNQALCSLLSETKAELAKGSLVSCATPMWYPGVLWGWSDSYFRQVCSNCDQVALMCYDSFFYLPRAYSWLLSQQCAHVLADAAAPNTGCRVLLGVPSYDDGTAGHLNQPENLKVALPAVRNGLEQNPANRNSFDGVAIFAEYTTDENEWQDYRHLWLGQP